MKFINRLGWNMDIICRDYDIPNHCCCEKGYECMWGDRMVNDNDWTLQLYSGKEIEPYCQKQKPIRGRCDFRCYCEEYDQDPITLHNTLRGNCFCISCSRSQMVCRNCK